MQKIFTPSQLSPSFVVTPYEFMEKLDSSWKSSLAGSWRWRFSDASLHRFWLIHPCVRQTDRRTELRWLRRTKFLQSNHLQIQCQAGWSHNDRSAKADEADRCKCLHVVRICCRQSQFSAVLKKPRTGSNSLPVTKLSIFVKVTGSRRPPAAQIAPALRTTRCNSIWKCSHTGCWHTAGSSW